MLESDGVGWLWWSANVGHGWWHDWWADDGFGVELDGGLDF